MYFESTVLSSVFTTRATLRRSIGSASSPSRKQIEESRHRVPHHVAVWRHVPGLPDVQPSVAVTREVGGFEDAGGDARRKRLPIPFTVIFLRNRTRICAFQDTHARKIVEGCPGLV